MFDRNKINRNNISISIDIINTNISGLAFTSNTLLTPGHSFTWYVAAVSNNGVASNYFHAGRTFMLAPLTAPTLISPSGTIAADDDTPTFTWSSVLGADHYYLYVVDDVTGAVLINNPNINGTLFTAITPFTPGHSITWYVAAVSTNGLASTYSPGGMNTPVAPLDAPTLIGPAAGLITAVDGYDRPTFTWSSVTGADHYYLYIVDTTTGMVAINNPNVIGATFTLSAAQALTPGHTFTWYVGAISTNGLVNSYLTSGRTFTLAALSAPDQTNPSGTIAAANHYDTPTFSWSTVAGADHYYLYVVDNTAGKVAINNPNVIGTTFTAIDGLTPGHSFTWYVGADSKNGLANSYLPTGATFSLAALAPPTPSGPSGTINETSPAFSWTPVTGADHYYLYVFDNTTGQVVINNPNVDANASPFTPGAALTRGHRYTWYIGAISTNGLVNRYLTAGLTFDIA